MSVQNHKGGLPSRARILGIVDRASLVLIVVFMVSAPVPTLAGLPDWVYPTMDTLQWVISGLFLLEYAYRIWAAERRLQYLFSPFGIVDFVSIVPALVFPVLGLQELRALRLLRLFRIVKIARYSVAMRRFAMALKDSRDELVLFTLTTVVVVYLASFGIYYFEHEAQPEVFKSVFHAWWWAVATLTTVGYGDIYPITTGGRIFTSVIVFIGLGVVAVPTGIIAAALGQAKANDEIDQGRDVSVCIEEILAYLNEAHVRCTYGAIGEVFGIDPQSVAPQCLGDKRKEASWVVNSRTGEPTGYDAAEQHPRLKEHGHIITSGAELLKCMREHQGR